jgi:hypothetical protein
MGITSIAVMVGVSVVIMICLVVQLGVIALAARRPYFQHPRREAMPTGVRGGRHIAVGGRSVAPNRYALAVDQRAESMATEMAQVNAAPAPRVSAETGTADAAEQDAAAVPVPRSGHVERPSAAER